MKVYKIGKETSKNPIVNPILSQLPKRDNQGEEKYRIFHSTLQRQ